MLTLYPQLLGGESTLNFVGNYIPDDYAPWKMGVQGLESFPMYGTYYENGGFYGIKDVMEDASAFIKSSEADKPDIWGYLGKIPNNTGFLQALYALAILTLAESINSSTINTLKQTVSCVPRKRVSIAL